MILHDSNLILCLYEKVFVIHLNVMSVSFYGNYMIANSIALAVQKGKSGL